MRDSHLSEEPRPSDSNPVKKKERSELSLRLFSAAILIFVALIITWDGGWPFVIFWSAAGALVVFEWFGLIFSKSEHSAHMRSSELLVKFSKILIAFLVFLTPAFTYAGNYLSAFLMTLAAIITGAGWTAIVEKKTPRLTLILLSLGGVSSGLLVGLMPVWMRAIPGLGLTIVAWMFAVTWSTDIAAYFSGRAIGGPKLWARVSPNKTWAGFLGGSLAGTLMGWLVGCFASLAGIVLSWSAKELIVASAIASFACQAGDLAESALKRRAGVKDSGHIIPGHGGVMDRLDGFIAVCFVVAVGLLVGAMPVAL